MPKYGIKFNGIIFRRVRKNEPLLKLFVKTTLIASFLFFSNFSIAQNNHADSASFQKAIDNTLAVYHRFLGNENGLYNGPNYVDYQSILSEGTPFFLSTSFQNGTITYNDIYYSQVLLLFDIFKNKIITKRPGLGYFNEFINDRVSNFTVLNHRFIKLMPDTDGNIEPGFYEILFEGKQTILYKKYIKKKFDDLSESKVRYKLSNANVYYLKENDTFYKFFNKRTLLKAYKTNRKKVRTFMRKNHIKVSADADADMIKVAAFNDALEM